ncbi:MAG: class I SAM-dependent methyltransferase [Candidatus Paracaedibacteraceae bacterium]|nr:class I SAM-dependent methyltransferase [Candidatus Paracaedibacteraceae bacterium]
MKSTPNKFYEPTQNQLGYMTTQIDQVGYSFLDFAQQRPQPILEIGAAYGHVALEAAKRQIPIIVNDLDQRHLDALVKRADEKHLKYILPLLGNFPKDLVFKPNSLGSILICRVLHFFPPEEWIQAMHVMFEWLAPGGKLFMTNESPYFGTMRKFIPVYLERKRKGHPWPGLMIGMEYFDEGRKQDVNSVINLLSLKETKAAVEEAGFHIEYIEYLDRSSIYPPDALYDGREAIGVIARKKSIL